MEENYIGEELKQIIENLVTAKIGDEIDEKVNKFREELLFRKEQYISEVMKGIRIAHEKEIYSNRINYIITFENIYKIEK